MIYIQVYIPDKNIFVDYKVSSKITICTLKSLIVESMYNIRYDINFIKSNYTLMDFNNRKRLKDDLKLQNYSVYNGYKFLLI